MAGPRLLRRAFLSYLPLFIAIHQPVFLKGEGTIYRVDDTFSTSDHVMAGGAFLIYILVSKSCPEVFNWICEGSTPTGIREMSDVRGKMSDSWYDLQGRKLNGKPSQKGVYINNGKAVVIK